ncbi:MAG: SRPBCC family protein [Burkholderiales bacterium]|jgi:ribosome-associated toxin RatA of RatAB toxin-antitoxin module
MRPSAALFLLWTAVASAAEGLSVETMRRGSAVEVRAYALIEAEYGTVWSTLTDYEHLSEFVPGMSSSRVLEHRGNTWIVEQRGVTRFLFFSHPVEVTVIATARPPQALDVRLLKGNLKRLDGGYRVEQARGGKIALRWIGLVEPQALPPLLGELVMRANIRAQFAGMVREIERREGELRRGPRPKEQ